jgi:hypothetical protein
VKQIEKLPADRPTPRTAAANHPAALMKFLGDAPLSCQNNILTFVHDLFTG